MSLKTMNNPLTSRPGDFDVVPIDNQDTVRLKGKPVYAKFFMIGLLQAWSFASKGTSFQIAPNRACWGRTLALFGSLFKERSLYFGNYLKGLTFSTRLLKGEFHCNDDDDNISLTSSKVKTQEQ